MTKHKLIFARDRKIKRILELEELLIEEKNNLLLIEALIIDQGLGHKLYWKKLKGDLSNDLRSGR